MEWLQVVWFFLIAALLAVFSVLDGFDLGAGFWSLFSKGEEDRGRMIGAVGPFWDGNEVWLLAGGGAIFAAFPEAYATIFSGFYFAFIAVALALALRAVSIEFRARHVSRAWRRFWGFAFGISSALPPVIFGVAVGNVLMGIPLDSGMNYTGSFFDLLGPYALLAGLVVLALFAGHGAAFLSLKLDGAEAECARRRAAEMGVACATLLAVYFGAMAILVPELSANYRANAVLSLAPLLAVGASVSTAVLSHLGKKAGAFFSQGLSIFASVAAVAIALFPNVVPTWDPASAGLSVADASSSFLTLKAMLIIAAVGMPFVVVYHVWIYRAFSSDGGEGQ